jgi:hypothetical protein
MTRPVVSVIVPCYRYADVLPICVRSVLAQDGVDVKVLIVDDCSPDDTPEVAGRLADADARVTYVRNAENLGLIPTANRGLAWADGDHVVLISADDWLTPGALHRAATVFERHPEVGMVYGRPLYARSDRPVPAVRGRWRGTSVWTGQDWIRGRCRTAHNCVASPEMVVRNSVQQRAGGYDASCFHTSDLNMWLRCAALADVGYVRGVPQAVYRIHPGSMLRSQDGPLVDLFERQAAFDAFFAGDHGLPEAEAAALNLGVRRTLARQSLWQACRAIDRDRAGAPVDEFVAYALENYPDTRALPEWRGLQVRRKIGAGRSQWFPPFAVTGATHRVRLHTDRLRWRLTGL